MNDTLSCENGTSQWMCLTEAVVRLMWRIERVPPSEQQARAAEIKVLLGGFHFEQRRLMIAELSERMPIEHSC